MSHFLFVFVVTVQGQCILDFPESGVVFVVTLGLALQRRQIDIEELPQSLSQPVRLSLEPT